MALCTPRVKQAGDMEPRHEDRTGYVGSGCAIRYGTVRYGSIRSSRLVWGAALLRSSLLVFAPAMLDSSKMDGWEDAWGGDYLGYAFLTAGVDGIL